MQEVARLIRHFRFGDQQPDEPSLAGAPPSPSLSSASRLDQRACARSHRFSGSVGSVCHRPWCIPPDPSRRCIVRTLPPLPLSFFADLDNPIVARIMSNNTLVSEQNNKVDQPIPLRV